MLRFTARPQTEAALSALPPDYALCYAAAFEALRRSGYLHRFPRDSVANETVVRCGERIKRGDLTFGYAYVVARRVILEWLGWRSKNERHARKLGRAGAHLGSDHAIQA